MATTTKLVSYEDWLRMPEVDDAIEEVVNGEIVRMPPPKITHTLSPEARTIEVLQLENGKLRTATTIREGQLQPKHFPEAAVDIASIWPD